MKKYNINKNLRISVFRSNKHIYVQIIDDNLKTTLTSSSSVEVLKKNDQIKHKTKIEISYEVGKLLGIKAQKLKLKKVVFDKGKYMYHGRVKSLANGIRKMGLNF
ncbi:50S ribosomal protein L18 [Blattabacterium cuenoti]|uniref:50S ribosomal protein L18 n=1 Tax=Blattabacterium cuenoti TaxID=1653831 RepID=UPI00163D2F68|nr:50S ribosomal protein L18 [Blattabacterium cuenoti]